jgi:DNA/RNA endonuclease G (NUC1)
MSKKIARVAFALALLTALLFSSGTFFNISPAYVEANGNAQTVPFSQNWSNTNLITALDDWNNVPGIIGYRGDALTASTGTDPQTILADGSATPVNVWANQTDPNTFLSGGVAEFDTLPNPTVALNGSGTADAPHIVINLNTSGTTAINVAYNLRDIDGSADDAVQPVALQYRIGNSGNYTNLPSGFVADASSGPNQATLVTAVSVLLPQACENQPLVQVRVITTNANGNDEWIGVDDINITGTGGGSTQLSGSGLATPATVAPSGTTLLTVAVTPATNPTSTGITVNANLSSIGGSATQQFFDDGTNGDATAGDNTFSYSLTIPANASGGSYGFLASIADAQARTASTTINLTVAAPPNPAENLALGNPSNAVTDLGQLNNYLMVKSQYVLSYNCAKGEANWVSWHLDSTWLGTAPRQDDYRADPAVPQGCYQVQGSDYSGSGFDRGHLTPSADRTSSIPDNSATFLMTNFIPQAPANNQGPWEELESYLRTLVGQGNEIYIIAGGYGQGGVGSNGAATTVANGRVVVPAYTWKIAVVLPNRQDIGINTPWRNFITNVKQIEANTGLNFFTNVRPQMRQILKIKEETP